MVSFMRQLAGAILDGEPGSGSFQSWLAPKPLYQSVTFPRSPVQRCQKTHQNYLTLRPSPEPLPLFSSLIHSFFYCREVSLSCHHLAIRVILVISSHSFIHYVSLEVADCTTSGPFALSPTQPQNVRCTLTPAFVASTVLCPFPSPLRSSPTASKGLSSFLTHIS